MNPQDTRVEEALRQVDPAHLRPVQLIVEQSRDELQGLIREVATLSSRIFAAYSATMTLAEKLEKLRVDDLGASPTHDIDRRAAHIGDREALVRRVMERYRWSEAEAREAIEAFGG